MSWFKSILDVIANIFSFITQYFREKNAAPVKKRKEEQHEEEFKNIAKKAISKRDVKKVRDLLSE